MLSQWAVRKKLSSAVSSDYIYGVSTRGVVGKGPNLSRCTAILDILALHFSDMSKEGYTRFSASRSPNVSIRMSALPVSALHSHKPSKRKG